MSGNTTFTEFPAESRIGRENQVFDENDIRQVSNLPILIHVEKR